ncbi:MAG: zf-HC2 domain-containing protein [Candidatus Eremiobacteraeota bacterium]|nr:zf-HC2 domain-containing protein [Candidatus Eremiobacteraeota bacterium]
MNHIDELAESYALGALDDDARHDVEQHVARCATCATRLSDAADVVASLVAAGPGATPAATLRERLLAGTRRPERLERIWGGLAAAFVLGMLVPLVSLFWIGNRDLRADHRSDVVLATLVNSHFNHVQFNEPAAEMPAKALYGRHGEWVYVIVLHPHGTLVVEGRSPDGVFRPLGSVVPQGRNGTMFAEPTEPVDALRLLSDGTVVGTAKLVTHR